jgi:hypothetical protein
MALRVFRVTVALPDTDELIMSMRGFKLDQSGNWITSSTTGSMVTKLNHATHECKGCT